MADEPLPDDHALADRPAALEACRALDAKILADVEFWYGQARECATNPGRNALPRITLILAMLERIAPQQKAATKVAPDSGVKVQINNVSRGSADSVDEAKRINGR